MNTIFSKFLSHKIYLWLLVIPMLLITGISSAQNTPGYVHLVQVMDSSKTGLANPVGVVYSSRADLFHVIEAKGNPDQGSEMTQIKDLSVFGHAAGATSLKIAIDDPLNITMDNLNGRLLIYQNTTKQLIEIKEDASGKLDSSSLAVYDASYFGLQVPQGMTFDPIQNCIYFLDAVGPQIVRITLPPDGGLIGAIVDAFSLSWASNLELRGIAMDPETGNFQVMSPGEQSLYEVTSSGEVVAVRDLSSFNILNPQGILIAPSGDQTDDPAETSIYVVDSGSLVNLQTGILSADTNKTSDNPGDIIELSIVQPQAIINADFTSTLVETTNMAAFTKPSTDPCGVTYINSSNTLLATDSEIEEIIGGITHFAGANLWEMTLGGSVVNTANISPVRPTSVTMTAEPTDVAYNPHNGHFYFTDDVWGLVFDLNPGVDGQYGTADDSWTSFPTDAEDGDPEGIAYDSWHDQLFVLDGVNREVYQYTLDGNLLNHFDVEVFDLEDTEGITFNPISGTLYIMSNLGTKIIVETDTSGTELQTIDFSESNATDPAGLAYAPASDGSGAMRFYIVDRGLDNNQFPNEVDGKMYEMTAPVSTPPITNTPPLVDAGPNQTVSIAAGASLSGSASDDGLPNPPAALTISWSKVAGPGSVTFGDPSALITTASFSETGFYDLRLSVSDSEYTIYDDIMINVVKVAGSSIIEERVLTTSDAFTSSDDAEEGSTGAIDLVSPSLDMTWPSQTIGVRFVGVNLPKNALINNAYIQFATQSTTSNATSLTIKGEAQDNPGTFTITNQDITTRTRTTASVNWVPASWLVLNESGVKQRTSDITAILQELISRPGWSQGNSMVFIIGGSGIRSAWSFDGSQSKAPRLHIEYTISTNHVPVAQNDSYSTNEDATLNVYSSNSVLKNDSDADHDPLTAIKYTDPAHGTVTLNSNGSFTYVPVAKYNGADSFTYYAYDGHFKSNIATVNITVNAVNYPPVAVNDAYSTNEDSQLTVSAPGVLSNDTDPDPEDTLTAVKVSNPSHGTLSLNANGSIVYTPASHYNGSDSFTYRASDGHTNSNLATVTITINPVNYPPVAVNDNYSTNEDIPLIVLAPGVLSNDTDPDPEDILTAIKVTDPSHGTLTFNSNGSFTYVPAPNYYGSDSFTYQASDGHVTSSTATVNLTINSVNDPPVAVNDTYSTDENAQLVVPAPGVLLNDTDVDGDAITAIKISNPSHGTLTFNSNGSFVYIPDHYYRGSDSFTYQAKDEHNATSGIATVTILVSPIIYQIMLPIIVK
jgi:VCBS repeat-containing protein